MVRVMQQRQRYLDLKESLLEEQKGYKADMQKILAGKVRSAMTLNPTTCDPGDTMQSVAAVMVRRRFNHVPVVDSSGKIVGILRRAARPPPVPSSACLSSAVRRARRAGRPTS